MLVYFDSQKPEKEKNITSYIVFWATSQIALAGLYGARQLGPQKDNVGSEIFFFPGFWLLK